jgi:hypothetical protein
VNFSSQHTLFLRPIVRLVCTAWSPQTQRESEQMRDALARSERQRGDTEQARLGGK